MPIKTAFENTLRSGLLVFSASVSALLVSVGPAVAQPATNASLTVNVTKLSKAGGQVCFSLFEGSQGFPNDEDAVVAQQCVPTVSEEADIEVSDPTAEIADLTVTFDDLLLGTYAVAVLHDENRDQQINQGSFGIPTEGFGFSGNPMVQTGAPEFAEAAVFVVGNTTTDIEMVYF